ncbi:MAG: DUF2764 family protein [Candidatus Omnitrophota bacterium]
MSSYYVYLISSLPLLNFSSHMPFSLEEFFAKCQNLVPEVDILRLRNVSSGILDISAAGILKDWLNFDTALKNELVRIRAKDKKIDPEKYVRLPDFPQAHISVIALSAHRHNLYALEAEKILDQERWNYLDQLTLGHYFDFEALLIYALKLKILERWEKVENANKEDLYDGVLVN